MTMYGVSKRRPTLGHDSRPFGIQQNDIHKHVTNRLHYFKNLQKQLDAQATKASSIALRKQWLDKQNSIKNISKSNNINSVDINYNRKYFPNMKALYLPNNKVKWCKINEDKKNYCFRIPQKTLCNDGKIIYNTDSCDYF